MPRPWLVGVRRRTNEDIKKRLGLEQVCSLITENKWPYKEKREFYCKRDRALMARAHGGRKILRALGKKPMPPSEISSSLGTSDGELRAYLAHLTRRYMKLKKEALHQWNENIQKYEINPKYSRMIQRLLSG
jgi:hypothetical protein